MKKYLVIFNDVTDESEVGDSANWDIGTLAFDITLKALFVRFGGGWVLVGTQAP